MIEIRVNNGVIEYRTRIGAFPLSRSGLLLNKEWSEWRKAEYFGRAFTATQEQCLAARANGAQLSALEGVKVWFDEAADINSAAWQGLTETLKPGKVEFVPRLDGERKKVEQRDQENKALHAELDELKGKLRDAQIRVGDALIDLDKVRDDNRKLTNANQIVREQRNAARMEAITAERKRVDTEAMLKTAEQVLLQRQGELDTVRQVLDLTKSEGKRYAFRSGRAREWLKRLVDYVDGNPEYSYADLVSGIRQELARKD